MVKTESDFKSRVQRFGSYLSGMVMPNIGAFIAWGLITALFIPTGWLPNETFAALVDPMITYLLPLLIAYSGGKLVHGHRGGVVGAAASMGVIVGASIPMFLGVMVVGPLGGFLMKKFDQAVEGKIRSGFEMLVNNFSAGILATILALISNIVIGPVVVTLSNLLAAGVNTAINLRILPLSHIFIEPAKVLFLNNAINHGILGPLGVEQATSAGKSILFMLEANPGPGLGILLAFMVFGKGSSKDSAYGSAIIHFLGGIHEIYFPYILMKPSLILAAMAGGITGTFVFSIFNVGLVATPSPGSIFAFLAMTPRGGYLGVILGVVLATLVSFLVASAILRMSKDEEEDLALATRKMEEMKGRDSSVAHTLLDEDQVYANAQKIIFACDAGMGSSAMGASLLKKKIQEAELDVEVVNTSISNIPEDADIIITHKDLTRRAKDRNSKALHLSVDNFLGSPIYDEIIDRIKGK